MRAGVSCCHSVGWVENYQLHRAPLAADAPLGDVVLWEDIITDDGHR